MAFRLLYIDPPLICSRLNKKLLCYVYTPCSIFHQKCCFCSVLWHGSMGRWISQHDINDLYVARRYGQFFLRNDLLYVAVTFSGSQCVPVPYMSFNNVDDCCPVNDRLVPTTYGRQYFKLLSVMTPLELPGMAKECIVNIVYCKSCSLGIS